MGKLWLDNWEIVFRLGTKHVGKPEGKRLHGSPRRKWEDNIKMNLQELGKGGMDWIDLRKGTGGGHL